MAIPAKLSDPPEYRLPMREFRRFTVAEVMQMVEAGILAEDESIELLDGVLVVMSPQGPKHSYITTKLREQLSDVYRGRPDSHPLWVREEKPLEAGWRDLPEPDLVVVCGRADTYIERHPRGDETLLVIEVAYTSLELDRAKAAIYARAAVPVYWLIDVRSGRIEVCTEPQPDEGCYRVTRVLAGTDVIKLPQSNGEWRVADLLLPPSC